MQTATRRLTCAIKPRPLGGAFGMDDIRLFVCRVVSVCLYLSATNMDV